MQPGSKGITGKKFLIQADGIKGRVAKEGVRVGQRMRSEKVLGSRNRKPCNVNGFVFIKGTEFLIYGNCGVLFKESLVVKIDVSDDASPFVTIPIL